MYTKIRHAGYYLENKFQKNNVQNLLLHKARQIHRLECNLGASQILNSNIPKKLGHFLPKVLRAGHFLCRLVVNYRFSRKPLRYCTLYWPLVVLY